MKGRSFQYMATNGDKMFEARKQHTKEIGKKDMRGGKSGKDKDGDSRIGETRKAHAS